MTAMCGRKGRHDDLDRRSRVGADLAQVAKRRVAAAEREMGCSAKPSAIADALSGQGADPSRNAKGLVYPEVRYEPAPA